MKQRRVVDFFRGILFVSATLVALTLGSGFTFAQDGSVANGIVRDVDGEPIIGANVVEKGTANGTITDFDGKFSLTVTRNATLVISYVGMKDKEVRAAKNMIVNLQENSEVLDELVVVGYGTQKKANLTGAVSSVDVTKTLESQSQSNVGRALQGAVPGLTITNSTGNINDDPNIVIRGVGTLSNSGSTPPLYVVDGVPVDNISYLNGNDIESISVLKDASSASIYGTRAAFGVILITTKTAKDADKCKVTYSGYFGWSQATELPNYPTVMQQVEGLKEVNYRMGLEVELFGAYLDTDHFKEGAEKSYAYYGGKKAGYQPMKYGIDYDEFGYYTDWDVVGIMFNKAAPSMQHNLSVQGNSGKTQYYMSMGYDQEQSLMNFHPNKLRKYNATVNLSTQATDWLTVGARFNYSQKNYTTPSTRGCGSYQYLWRWGSFFGPYGYWEDADGKRTDAYTYLGALNTAGDITTKNAYMRAGAFAKIDFINKKDHKFNLNADYTYVSKVVDYKSVYLPSTTYYTWGMLGEDPTPQTRFTGYSTFATQSYTTMAKHVANAYLNYNGTFAENHHLNVMAGANLDKDETKYLSLTRYNLQDLNMPELILTNDTTDTDYSQSHSHNGSVGFFGRINYDYKGIYLIELNGRFDGSSKFPSGNQWAFFPSASIGYRISEEAYFGKAKDYVSNLKVRASYGSVGNQEVGSNMFLETMAKYTAGVSWFNAAGTGLLDYFGQPKMVSSALTWETINTTNVGIDLGFLNNALNVTFDWFQRDTKNMLAPGKALPDVIGINAAYENAGSLRTRGWELTIDWHQQFGKWNVYATANLADYKSVVTKWDSNNLINEYYAGKEYGEIWGFQTDRYFTNEDFNGKDDAGAWIYKNGVASQVGLESNGFVYGPGDIKFVDQNNDGVIDAGDGTPENHGDLIKIGNWTPRYQYSLRAGFDYETPGGNIDFDVFFQGVGKREMWTTSAFVMPFMRGADALYSNMVDQYITKEMIDNNQIDQSKRFPYPWGTNNGQGNISSSIIDNGNHNFYPQTKYIVNMAYLRLKNITLGYTLPRQLTRKATIEKVRIYGSILNPFDIINHNQGTGIDPEVSTGTGTGAGYNGSTANASWGRAEPIYRTYSVGLQVEF
ncbi:MAG: TonB-dependent receptor [Bacteroidales bacterium]|jgi:TonB-linked SusC/RagA family outer membrane protein|nr:TonB-dependent receptor [Bacteroidales bacterium]